MKCGSWESRAIRPIIRIVLEVFLRGEGPGEGGLLTHLTFPPKKWGGSWKCKQAFRTDEAVAEHFYREKDLYDMMCCERGPTGTALRCKVVVVDLVLCLTRPCQALSFLSTDLPTAYL